MANRWGPTILAATTAVLFARAALAQTTAVSEDSCASSPACRDKGYCFYDAERGVCDDRKVPKNPAMMKGGYALIGIGGASFTVGFVAFGVAIAKSTFSGSDATYIVAAGTGLGGLGLSLGVGLPLVLAGAERVSPEVTGWRLQLGGTGAQLELRF